MRRVSEDLSDLHRYDDLIDYEYSGSRNRKRMAVEMRAAQFAPFAALTGYEEQIAEASRLTSQRPVLSQEQIGKINEALVSLSAVLPQHPQARILWFHEDEKKEGGEILCTEGTVEKIDRTAGTIRVCEDTVSFENICEIICR